MTDKQHETYESLSADEKALVDQSIEMTSYSYSPYSRFPVGCSILAENDSGDRKRFGGCNIENASYGAAICAERTAAVKAVSSGFKKFLTVSVFCSKSPGGSPCGVCRQFLREFMPDGQVLVVQGTDKSVSRWMLSELLPSSFGPESLPA